MMKRVVLISLLALCAPVVALGQGPLRFGVKAGVSFPRQTMRIERKEIKVDQGFLFGYHVGGEVLVELPLTGLEIEANGLFHRKGSKNTAEVLGAKVEHTRSMYYIDFPLKLNYFLGFGGVGIYLGAGPTFSVGLFGNEQLGKGNVAIDWSGKDGQFSRFDMALSAQVGVRVTSLQINAFYDYGVYNTVASKSSSITNQIVGISLGYLF